MIITKEEYVANYDEYQFGYTVWGVPETDEDIKVLYEQGFLPYSGSAKSLP